VSIRSSLIETSLLTAAASGTLGDGTELEARIKTGEVAVKVRGIPDSIAEVAQQLAWLGAALRSSPRDTGVVYCVPFMAATTSIESSTPYLRYSIKFRFEECEQPVDGPGQCWHSLFRNPVIARGFPITTRPTDSLCHGLELPLELAAKLVGTKFVDRFGDDMFLKGYSSMAVVTGRQNEVCTWHFLYKKDGNRIRYTDSPPNHTTGISNAWDVHNSRHIIGWSPDTSYNIGRLLDLAGGKITRFGRPTAKLSSRLAGGYLRRRTIWPSASRPWLCVTEDSDCGGNVRYRWSRVRTWKERQTGALDDQGLRTFAPGYRAEIRPLLG